MAIFRYTEKPSTYHAYLIEGYGNDANDGLTPQTAVASTNRLVTILNTYTGALQRRAVIVKRRISEEAITVTRSTVRPIIFEFVLNTEIYDGSLRLTFNISGDRLINARFFNYTNTLIPNTNAAVINFDYCGLINCTGIATSSSTNVTMNFNFSYLVSCSLFSGLSRSECNFENSVVFSTTNGTGAFSRIRKLRNSILYNSNLNLTEAYDTSDVNFNCMFNSKIANKTQEQLALEGKNTSGFEGNPQFNDIINNVYTVRSSSPCLYRGANGEHIGIGEGIWISANELYNNADIAQNTQVQSGKLLRIDDSSDGFLQTSMMTLGGVRSISLIQLIANLGYLVNVVQKTATSKSFGNILYDSGNTYHTGAMVVLNDIKYVSIQDNNTGNNPSAAPLFWQRKTWEAKSYSTGFVVEYLGVWYQAKQTTSLSWILSEWQQVILGDFLVFKLKYGRTFSTANAASWTEFGFNQPLLQDINGKGNMDDMFDVNTQTTVRFNFWMLRIDFKTIR